MTEPQIDEVTPREGVKVLLGDNVQTDILLLLHGERRTLTARELLAALDHDRVTIAEEINKLARVNAIECPKPGMYRLTRGPVGGSLHDLIDMMAERTRELHGLDRLEDCVA